MSRQQYSAATSPVYTAANHCQQNNVSVSRSNQDQTPLDCNLQTLGYFLVERISGVLYTPPCPSAALLAASGTRIKSEILCTHRINSASSGDNARIEENGKRFNDSVEIEKRDNFLAPWNVPKLIHCIALFSVISKKTLALGRAANTLRLTDGGVLAPDMDYHYYRHYYCHDMYKAGRCPMVRALTPINRN